MAIYNVFQCSVCHRIKDILQDPVHAAPNQCTITKSCSGFLFPIGETTILTPPAPVVGLTDWYPRGQKPSSVPLAPAEQTVDLSTSDTGVITMALYVPTANAPSPSNPWGASPPANIVAAFTQQLTQDIPYNEFIFNVGTTTNMISGQDSTGKNLRFSLTNVVDGLVFVLVNGVASFPGDTPNGWTTSVANQITFNNPIVAGSIVTVSVFVQPPTATVFLQFNLNQTLIVGNNSGSWGNIRWVEEYSPTTGALKSFKWWLYSCTQVADLGNSARLSLIGVFTDNTMTNPVLPYVAAPTDFSGIRFLLAAPPHDNTDRYLNFYIDGNLIAGEFALVTATSTITELFADRSVLAELYPPFQLIETANLSTSYISADTFPTDDSVSLSTPESLLAGTKILGPT